MASRLFHTVFGVGIALSAASVGCSSSAETTGVADESALISASGTETRNPSATDRSGDAGPDWSAFCDAVEVFHHPRPACIDPHNECRNQGGPFECSPEGT